MAQSKAGITGACVIVLVLTLEVWYIGSSNVDLDEKAARLFIDAYEEKAPQHLYKLINASWNYGTNITNETNRALIEAKTAFGNFQKHAWKAVRAIPWEDIQDSNLKRKFQFLSVLGYSALEDEDSQKLTNATSTMAKIYSTTKVCSYGDPMKCELRLEPDIRNIFSQSREERVLLYTWQQWHNTVGKPLRPLYSTFVEYANKASQLNGFADNGEMRRNGYNSSTFLNDVQHLWEQVKPLYLQLHAYVRRKLLNYYGENLVKPECPIPAHLLGSVWGSMWSSIRDITNPFPNRITMDITQEMLKQNYTARKMFEMAEEFFTSLGFEKLFPSFWEKSMFEQPTDREVVCHAMAFTFMDRKDFRIKMCTQINMEDFLTVHHEMGHIQYFMQYRHQPFLFQLGANPGFHEAVGDTIALSVSTVRHLRAVGLLSSGNSEQDEIDQLLALALDSVAFLPYGYLVDLWQWDVFRGKITKENYNANWWKLRLELQGVAPPVPRNEEYFDPGVLFHISNGSPYIMYFVAGIIQFQFHKGLCEEAGKYVAGEPQNALHKCDIYNSKVAGNLLMKALQLGSSRPWPEVMNILTRGRTSQMDAGPLLEYFSPLMKFLVEENERNHDLIGWKDCSRSISFRRPLGLASTLLITAVVIFLYNFVTLNGI